MLYLGLIQLITSLCCAKGLQSCLTLCDPINCSQLGSSVHGIPQARILEWLAMPSSRGIFLTQGSNPGLLHCRQILYQNLSHWGSPIEPELLPFHYFRQQFFPLWNRSPDSFQFQSHCSLCFPSAIVFILKAFSSTSPNSFSSRASP